MGVGGGERELCDCWETFPAQEAAHYLSPGILAREGHEKGIKTDKERKGEMQVEPKMTSFLSRLEGTTEVWQR